MKASIIREVLLEALASVSGIIPARTPKPIIQNVLLEVKDDDTADVLATDLEVSIRRSIGSLSVVTTRAGSVVLPAAKLRSILSSGDGQDVLIEASNGQASIECGQAFYEIPVEDAALFPEVPGFDAESHWEVQSRHLAEATRRVGFATDPNTMKFALGGIRLEFEGSRFNAVATDGKRVAVSWCDVVPVGDPSGDAKMVQVKAMKLVSRVTGDDGPPVHVAFSKTAAMFRTADASIHSRLVQGNFPNYLAVMDMKRFAFRVKCEPFRRAIEQASITTNTETVGVRLRIEPGRVSLSSEACDSGRSNVFVSIDYDGLPATMVIQPFYTIDMLRVVDDDATISFSFDGDDSLMRLDAGDGYAYMMTPIVKVKAKDEAA